MASLSESYMREIASQWGYLVTWLPSRTVRLGQTGRFDGIQVHIDGDIGQDGFSFSEDSDDNESELEYNSAGAVSFGWSAGAGLVTGERAEFEVSFSREKAIVLHLHGAVEHRVGKLKELKRAILKIDARSGWEKHRAVVVSVVNAASSTVLISSGQDASVRCEARAGEALGNLANPRIALQRTSSHSMHTALVSQGGLTPLYQALVMRKGMLGSRSLEGALRGPETMDASDPLRDAIDDDFALCAVGAPSQPNG